MNVLTTRNVWTTMIWVCHTVGFLCYLNLIMTDNRISNEFMFKWTLSNWQLPQRDNIYFSVFPKFTPQLFFLYLLPPIILEAAYCLHNEHFFDNIRSILFFAVVGTLINFVLTGGLLIFVKVEGDRLICVEGQPTFLILFRPLALLTLETLCPLWKSWYSPVSSGKIRNN